MKQDNNVKEQQQKIKPGLLKSKIGIFMENHPFTIFKGVKMKTRIKHLLDIIGVIMHRKGKDSSLEEGMWGRINQSQPPQEPNYRKTPDKSYLNKHYEGK